MKRALVSVSDKTGLVEFLRPLIEDGLKIVSTGGTLKYLRQNGFEAQDVSEVTQFPEVLDGRVKTLHPSVHMGLLADLRNSAHVQQLSQFKVEPFDIVIGNLYPFEKTALDANASEENLIENIDIGGPSFLRASAKNFHSVIVLSDPNDYQWVLGKILKNDLTVYDRKNLALKVFSLTSYYDALIVQRLQDDFFAENNPYLNLPLKKKQNLRYGENAQQKANWFENVLDQGAFQSLKVHQGKELSYNNLLDLDAAWEIVNEFEAPTCVAVKHNNPCGVASSDQSLYESCYLAIQADSKSIFGGIIAVNRELDLQTSQLFKDIFLECIAAPSFTEEALQFFSHKKNLRLLSLKKTTNTCKKIKSVSGGLLFQNQDVFQQNKWVFRRETPSASLLHSCQFAEKVAGYLKSNAIAIVYKQQTIGLGMGQVNRVDAVEQALSRMKKFIEQQNISMDEVVLASDAFFPFSDSIELIAKAGIRWVVQPGGSMKDAEVFAAAEANKVNLIVTNMRHFRH